MRDAFNLPTLLRVAGLLAICGAIPSVLAAEVEYTPTMQDTMSIQATMHRYHQGLDKHDNKLWASAFAEEGTLTLINHDQQMVLTRDQLASSGLMGSAPPGAGPAGAPSPGADGGPPGVGVGPPPADMGELWHFSEINSHFKFDSPTRATHYSYWMEVHVHKEKNSSTLAVPGHYEDVLIKRNGEWLFLSRKIIIGDK